MRSDILRLVTRRMDIEDFEPDELADLTEGLTGSDLRLVLREAVLDALTEERTTLTQEDLRRAVAGFEERDNLKNMDDFDNWTGSTSGPDADASGNGHSDHDHDHDHTDHDHPEQRH
jgi:SpoVK/Ycf46/Vps4 family AAA+-type ATPase